MMMRTQMRMRSWMTSPQKTFTPWLPMGVACPATSPSTARRRMTLTRSAPFTLRQVLEQGGCDGASKLTMASLSLGSKHRGCSSSDALPAAPCHDKSPPPCHAG